MDRCPICKSAEEKTNNRLGDWSYYRGEGQDFRICFACNQKIASDWHRITRQYEDRDKNFRFAEHRKFIDTLVEFNGVP